MRIGYKQTSGDFVLLHILCSVQNLGFAEKATISWLHEMVAGNFYPMIYSIADNNVGKWSKSCRGYESSIKDCVTAAAFWCPRPPVVACFNKPLDKRVCRKENDAPCAPGVCSEGATCVDGDDKIIPKEHSYCKYCPVNSYGDGYTCTGTRNYCFS